MPQYPSSLYRSTALKVGESETFSNSKVYQHLLLYLTDCALKGEVPKETTIAIEVFGKDESFNPAESTLVRVNIYNLRKKLQEYYLTEGKKDDIRLRIPKGSYKVEFSARQKVKAFTLQHFYSPQVIASLFILLLLALGGNYFLWQQKEAVVKTYQPVAPDNALWGDILSSPKPVLIVLGGLFVFQEYSEELKKNRVIRDVSINSASDLASFFSEHPDFESKISNTNYTHLIKNNAYSLKDIIPVLIGAQKTFDMRVMSRLTSEDLQQYNIIFIGLFKTMGVLEQYFETTPITYTEAPAPILSITDENGNTKEFIQTGSANAYHTDYGLVAKFPGPKNNFIFIFSGFQDTGVLQSVKNLTDPEWLQRIENQMLAQYDSLPSCFEILFRAQGIDRTEFDTEIVHLRALSPDLNIWQVGSEEE